MNKNPINQDYRWQLLYIGIWMFLSSIQIAVLYATTNMPLIYSMADTIVFNGLFALLALLLWYPVRFSTWKRKTWYFNQLAHLLLSSIVITFWVLAGYMIMRIFVADSNYITFLNHSIWWKVLEGFLFYTLIVLIYYLYTYIVRLNEKVSNEIKLNQLIKDGELNLLKSQINPHFLFNSLNSVNSMIIRNPGQAQKMLAALSDYLRYAVLSNDRIYATLHEEIENNERYLSIEKLRFGDKLVYEPIIDPSCLRVTIPSMLLQPLFENAIKHGVYESLETVSIQVTIFRTKDILYIKIMNNYDVENPSKKRGLGTGLQNIRERLRLLYGSSASFQTKTDEGKFIALLTIPIPFEEPKD